jgi:hypothetical protein
MIKIGGLWRSVDKNGQAYYSGTLGGVKIFVFPNNQKQQDNHPDVELFIKERDSKSLPLTETEDGGLL